MLDGALAGVRVIVFEARRGEELAAMLGRHGAIVRRAPALRETPLDVAPAARDLARRLADGTVDVVVLLTGVGTRALVAAAGETIVEGLRGTRIVARGPKPVAALRQLGVSGALPVHEPYTWREVLGVVDGLGLRPGARVAVQEYGVPPTRLLEGLAARGIEVLRVPVYGWALPDDTGPLRDAAAALIAAETDVAVFTNAAQAEHLFRVAPDAEALRTALARVVVASVGPTCSEALEAHGVVPDLEASPPKMGPLVALVAEQTRDVLLVKRAAAG
jgi:uroporphyrinogen-III synthase